MNKENAFLQVNDLVVEYTSGGKTIHAVNNVSFSLEKGKTLALVGETGAGKTTIAKAILRILPDHGARIADGSVLLDGKDLLKASEKEMMHVRGRRISIVFQDPMTALNPAIKIGPQVAEVIQQHNRISKAEAKQRAIEILGQVNIPAERYNEYPHQFSGGMKQRVIIAMALACDPEILIADEPTTALDVTIQAQVLALIKELKNKLQTSLLLITHDLGVVANMADAVAVIYAGEIVEYGSRDEIFRYPSHPYTQGLFNAIPDLDKKTEWLANIPGLPPDPAELPSGCCFHPRCHKACGACRERKPEMIEIRPNHYCKCVSACDGSKEV